MDRNNLDILCWNVHGLNAAARCSTVRNTAVAAHAAIVCLQETKTEFFFFSLLFWQCVAQLLMIFVTCLLMGLMVVYLPRGILRRLLPTLVLWGNSPSRFGLIMVIPPISGSLQCTDHRGRQILFSGGAQKHRYHHSRSMGNHGRFQSHSCGQRQRQSKSQRTLDG